MIRILAAVPCLAALAVSTSPAFAQNAAPGSYALDVVRSVLARNQTAIEIVDTDGDGAPEVFAAIPSASEVHTFDGASARRIILRGPSGIQFARRIAIGRLFAASALYYLAVSSSSSVGFYPVDQSPGGFGLPIPASIGILLRIAAGNFDADPEDEIALCGTTGWGYFDGGTNAFVAVRTGIPATDGLFTALFVRRQAGGPDCLIAAATGPTGGEIRKLTGAGAMLGLAALPALIAAVDAITEVQGTLVVSMNNGSFTAPAGEIRPLDEVNGVFLNPIVTDTAATSYPTLTRDDATGRWFYLRRDFGGVEEIHTVKGVFGAPQLRIQALSSVGLDVAAIGRFGMFGDVNPALLVMQRALNVLDHYSIDARPDLRVTATTVASGNAFELLFALGAAGAGAQIVPLWSLSLPQRLVVPGLVEMAFTFDPFTGTSPVFFGGAVAADANGEAMLSVNVPFTGGIPREWLVHCGFIAIRTDGTWDGNDYATGSVIRTM